MPFLVDDKAGHKDVATGERIVRSASEKESGLNFGGTRKKILKHHPRSWRTRWRAHRRQRERRTDESIRTVSASRSGSGRVMPLRAIMWPHYVREHKPHRQFYGVSPESSEWAPSTQCSRREARHGSNSVQRDTVSTTIQPHVMCSNFSCSVVWSARFSPAWARCRTRAGSPTSG